MNDSTALFILTSVIVWPLCNLLALIVAPNKSIATQFACLAGLPAAIAALLLPLTSQPLYFDLMLKGALGLDETGRGFLLFSSALWCAAGIYAKASIARDKQFSFYVFYLLAMSGNFALIFAQDILTFYGGYALMSLAFYGLLFAQDSTQTLNSQRLASAAKIYIAFTMISELSIFAAIALIEGSVGVTDFTSIQAMLAVSPYLNAIVLFLVIGFGIKTAVIGLHMWLPLTYCAAPIAATAILAGALAKVGVLGWLRMFPALEQPLFEWGTLLVVLGSVAAFYGVLIGITQRTLKAILAYSSISQLGIITLLCGLLLLIPAHRIELTAAITLYALHHGLNKGSLFLGVGLCRAERCTRRWMWLLMMLPALSLAGAPLSSGMLAKLALKEQIHALPEGRYALLSLAVTLMSIGTAVLVVKFLYHCKPNSATHHAHPHGEAKLAVALLFPFVALIIAAQGLSWFLADDLMRWHGSTFFQSAWPLGAGVALAVLVIHQQHRLPIVPLGDLLHLFKRPLLVLQRFYCSAVQWLASQKDAINLPHHHHSAASAIGARFKSAEAIVRRWPNAMITTIIIVLVFSGSFFI